MTAFLLSLAALLLFSCSFMVVEHMLDSSRHVKIQAHWPVTTGYHQHDYSGILLYRGQPLAVDTGTNTIYISQTADENTQLEILFKDLQLKTGGYQMYLIQDEAFSDLPRAMAEGHKFQLLILDRLKRYTQYDVVFTPLPVVSIQGQFTGTQPDTDRDIFSGDFTLWTPGSADGRDFDIQFSKATWHVRGGSSSWKPKKPWRLSLQKSNASPRHMELLGLGSDDDWILNPMNREDTKIREKLFMELWNREAAKTGEYPMSSGRYVELVENGKYAGLYLLQRRVDRKFLDLPDQAAMLKGRPISEHDDSFLYYYEVLSGDPASDQVLEPILAGAQPQALIPENLIDLNLFIQFANAADNLGPKNMFYILTEDAQGLHLRLAPWDTDMSFGIVLEEQFMLKEETAQYPPRERPETAFLRIVYPGLDRETALRWAELRKGTLSDASVFQTIDALEAQITESGAIGRDMDLWSVEYYGEDTVQALRSWTENRLAFLDEYYGLTQ